MGEKAEKTKVQEERAQKLAQKEERRNEKACKAAVKAVEKDDALKKPQSAYWLWLGDNRERIAKIVGSTKPTEVAKKGGEMWKDLTNAQRSPYDKKAQEQKEAYDKYIATPEGSRALQAFKDAQKAAKDQFKPKEAAVESAAEDKKRKANDETETEPAAKKGRGRPPKVQVATLGA